MKVDFYTGREVPEDDLMTVDAHGNPVDERISSVIAARNILRDMDQADQPDASRRARIKSLKDGDPPYDQRKLEELGLGNMVNISFLEMWAALDQKAAAWFELFFEVPTFINARCKVRTPNAPVADWGRVVSEEYTKTLRDWSGFLICVDQARRQADETGFGFALFADDYDFRPKSFQRGSLRIEELAAPDEESLEVFAVEDVMTAGEVYRKAFENPERARKQGWNPDVAKQILISVFVDDVQNSRTNKYATTTVESLQQMIRNNDADIQTKAFKKVRIVHLFVKEVADGAISHYILHSNSENGGTSIPEDDFIFKKVRRFKKAQQCIWLLPYNNGDGFLRSVRGLASRIEDYCLLSDRYLSKLFDAAFMSSSITLQAVTETDVNRIQLIRAGVVNVIPPGTTAIQSATFTPNLQQLVNLREFASALMRNNTGVFKMLPELFAENQTQKTARQVAEESSREARMEKQHIAYDYERLQRLHREIFRRLTNKAYVGSSNKKLSGIEEALDFVNRCEERGVPRDVLLDQKLWEVTVTQAIGMGSWGVQMDLSNQMLSMAPALGLDEAGLDYLRRYFIAVRVGQANVDSIKPPMDRNMIPGLQHQLATLESNDMAEGSIVPTGDQDNDAIHVMIHGQYVQAILQAVQQGQQVDVPKSLGMLQSNVGHLEKHLQRLSADPTRKEIVAQGEQLLKAAVQAYKQLQKALQQQMAIQQQQQAQQQQVLEEAQQIRLQEDFRLKAQKNEMDAQLEAQKQANIHERQSQRVQQQMSMREQQVQDDMARKNRMLDDELQRKNRELEAKLEEIRRKGQQ